MYLLGTIEEKRAATIKLRRKELRLTQQLASDRCGLPVRTYQRAEDFSENVDLSTIRAISSGMEIPLEKLVQEKESKKSDSALLNRVELFSSIPSLDDGEVSDLLITVRTFLKNRPEPKPAKKNKNQG